MRLCSSVERLEWPPDKMQFRHWLEQQTLKDY
jgi:hypothetical protein